jgi:hypothetical protein
LPVAVTYVPEGSPDVPTVGVKVNGTSVGDCPECPKENQ